MSYTFAAIVEQDDVDETWLPRIVDKQGSVQWHDEDGRTERFYASGLTTYQGRVDPSAKLLAVEKADITVHVSRARLVMVCRRDGKFLAGQLRWPWLSEIGYSEKAGWLTAKKLRLVAQDETGQWLYVDFELRKNDNPRRVAEQILHAAVTARTQSSHLDDDERAALAELELPRYDPESKRFATVHIPGARKALARTAHPEPPAAEPPIEVISAPAEESTATLWAPAEAPTATLAAPPPEPAGPPERAVCADCGHVLFPGAKFCRGCGLPVVDTIAAPAPPLAGEAVAPDPSTCPKCEVELPPRARFCRDCGHLLIADPPEPEPEPESPEPGCAHCGTLSWPGARFCRGCGEPLDAAAAPSRAQAVSVKLAVTQSAPTGEARLVRELGVRIVGPAGRVRTHRIELPHEPDAPVFATHVEAVPVGGHGPAFEGTATLAIGAERIVGVLTEGDGPEGSVNEERGGVLLFDLPLAMVDAVELTRSKLRRPVGVLLTSLSPPYALKLIVGGRRTADGSFVKADEEELAQAVVVAACDARLVADPPPALRAHLTRVRAGARADEGPNRVAELYLDDREPLAAPAASTRRRRRGGWPLLGATVAIAGVVVAVALFVTSGSDDPSSSSGGRAARLSTDDATATPTPEFTPEPTPEATETPVPAASSLVPGRYARLGSFRTQPTAQGIAEQLQAVGVDAQAISSNHGAGMMPAFWVVVAGPLATVADERRVRRNARKAGIRDAFVDDLAPAAGRLRTADLAGDFSGDLKQVNAKVKRLNKTISTTFSFSADGQSGTVIYDKPACTGALTLAGRKGAVAMFDETITDGKCSNGGRWHVRLEGDELLATWWRVNDLTFVIGRLSP